MRFNALKLKWAKRLLASKYFVLLTDKDSVIALNGVRPDSFEDQIALAAQTAAIEDFADRLQGLKHDHRNAALKTLNRRPNVAHKTRAKTAQKSSPKKSSKTTARGSAK